MGGCISTNTVATVQESTELPAGTSAAAAQDSVALRRAASRAFHRQYALDEKIGEGCFARVYACQRLGDKGDRSDESYAVKITDLLGHRDDTRERLALRESAILRQIGNQEHCCRLIDTMSCRRFHYIVLERCGLSLLQLLEEHMSELSERTLAPIARQMFLGVQAVHALGVVHRDIKPDNFLCTGPGGTVKLCDFGLAEVLPAGGEGITGVFGTAPFMSPEMIAGQVYERPVDVWSLGVIIYSLVVGQFPYIPEKPCVRLMRAAIAAGVPEPSFECTDARVELSAEVLALLKVLLDREPSSRPSVTEALELDWLSPDSGTRPQHCLRETLASAKRVGAFEMRSGNDSWRAVDSMDRALMELQKKHRLPIDPFCVGLERSRSGFSEVSTTDPSPSSSRGNSKVPTPAEASPSNGRANRAQPYGVLIAT